MNAATARTHIIIESSGYRSYNWVATKETKTQITLTKEGRVRRFSTKTGQEINPHIRSRPAIMAF